MLCPLFKETRNSSPNIAFYVVGNENEEAQIKNYLFAQE